jgi:glutathione peroxidase
MKKTLILASLAFIIIIGTMSFQVVKLIFSDRELIASRPASAEAKGSFYDYSLKSLDGKETINFSRYKGKKVVVINVASKCGNTPQYTEWQAFHKQYGDKIVVLGIPANNFKSQEPGSNEEIAEFCQKNYGVTFQMLEKVSVLGDDQAPLYKWLTHKDLNGWNDNAPNWNFSKYVINEKGELTHFFRDKVLPSNEEFRKAVGI